ncbi:MAG: ORF6N domain-containing protein, partial [Planctomycetota bacterium]
PPRIPAPGPSVELLVHQVRGHNILLDRDLAELYGTSTKRVNEQLRRNRARFPPDFAFRLTEAEWESLRSQSATSKTGRGGRRHPPYAFTEHGALMPANVLSSPRAVQASIQVVRAFVRLRRLLSSHQQLACKLAELEAKYDKQFAVVFQVIRQLMDTPAGGSTGQIGFHAEP